MEKLRTILHAGGRAPEYNEEAAAKNRVSFFSTPSSRETAIFNNAMIHTPLVFKCFFLSHVTLLFNISKLKLRFF